MNEAWELHNFTIIFGLNDLIKILSIIAQSWVNLNVAFSFDLNSCLLQPLGVKVSQQLPCTFGGV